MPNWKPGEIVCEFAGEKNQWFAFEPLQRRLRGRWSALNIREGSANTGFANLPVIPGMMVAVNIKERILRAIDPMSFPENQALTERVSSICEPWMGKMGPDETSTIRTATDAEIKSWLWALLGYYQNGHITMVNGTMPSKADILAMPGKLKIRYYGLYTMPDGTPQSPFATDEELAAFAEDENRPVETSRQLAGAK